MNGYHSPFRIKKSQRLMFITHPDKQYSEPEQVRMVLEAGCRWIQVRMKENPDRDKMREIIQLCNKIEDVICCINDYPEIAFTSGANALHVGKNDIPLHHAKQLAKDAGKEQFIIGATANTFEDICRAAEQKASYIGLGPFRFTQTKKNLSPVLGVEGYRKIIKECMEAGIQMPIFAIGGICAEDVSSIMDTGISGIVVSSSIIRSPDPIEETQRFLYEIDKY